jgi:DNA-binding XRE family transcriptional regulator
MARKFAELEAKMSKESRDWVQAEVEKTLKEMPLHELRGARGLSQKMLAEALHIQQPAIAKLEKRTDMYISTLRSHIEAMGGTLEIAAHFPDGTVKITNFSQIPAVPAYGERASQDRRKLIHGCHSPCE